MKTKKIAIISVILIMVFAIVSITIAGLIKTKETSIPKAMQNTIRALNITGSSQYGKMEVTGAHQSRDFYVQANGFSQFYYEASKSTLNKVLIPTINDVQLYCIQKGNGIHYNLSSPSAVAALAGKEGTCSPALHPVTSSMHSHLPQNQYSNTFYTCVNNHTQMLASGAYIVTAPSNFIAPTNGTYTADQYEAKFSAGENISKEVRQIAMWLNPEMKKGNDFYANSTFTFIDKAEQLKNEALDYRDYEQELKQNENQPIKETTSQRIKVNVNQDEQYFIIGPYKLNYIDGNAPSAKFAGISNMVVKGYNDKAKHKLVKDIEIVSYIQNGIERSLKFFSPNKEDGYVDRNVNSYPESNQEFYIKIKNPNRGIQDCDEQVRYVDVRAEYSYMTLTATQCELQGHQYVASAVQISDQHVPYSDKHNGKMCIRKYKWVVTDYSSSQQIMLDAWGERTINKLTIDLTGSYLPEEKPEKPEKPERPEEIIVVDISMSLGGYVWEDVPGGKENKVDGTYASLYNGAEKTDKAIPNVKVTLYECPVDENGNLQYRNGKVVSHQADLLSYEDKNCLSKQELLKRVNPQITDSNGYYQFDGLNAANKYYVVFEYNGQTYLPTEYLVTDTKTNENGETQYIRSDSVADMVFHARLYNTDTWRATSKAIEASSVRENYNQTFAEIGSAPENYESSNSLRNAKLVREGNRYYNEAFSHYDLMGFVLDENGKYHQENVQLVDGFYEIENGAIKTTNTIREGVISKKIQNYMNRYYEYPNEDALENIYEDIVGEYGKTEKEKELLWKQLQFIEDCKIYAYTGSKIENEKIDLYPVYDDFVVDNEQMVIPGVGTVPPIYDGQYYVNLGLWRRAKNDLALRKDVYRAATKINGKTEVYTYDKREENEKDYWEISLRMQDYENYYSGNYHRELFKDDYTYRAQNTNIDGKDLELYVTYKISIRNTSQGILNTVTEVVDYYDKDYTYMPNLSWVMYNEDGKSKQTSVSKEEYYNMIHNLDVKQIANQKNVDSSYGLSSDENGSYCGESIYGDITKQDLEQQYNSVYVHGLQGKKLATGEMAYIYLTFKVNPDHNGPVILDEDNSLKQNYSEINGYRSYYQDKTKLPNDVIMKGNDTVAGLIDYNSTPGNLERKDLEGNKYEKNFEDDTDRAKSIKVTIYKDDQGNDIVRNIGGTVWEDQRNKEVNGSIIGDGVRKDDEMKIQGVTVELVEKTLAGREYVWQTTKTDENGQYHFSGFIAGNYIVRFQYGDTNDTVLTINNGGKNAVSYNGQDFKSTVYQKDMNQNAEIGSYQDEYYDIQKADKLSVEGKANVSDAKDLWETRFNIATGKDNNYQNSTFQGRNTVNAYSSNNVNNHVAEVLAVPYAQKVDNTLLQELIQKTNMVAETAIIVTEIEYDRQNTDGDKTNSNGSNLYLLGNDKNGSYTINNVDFGLTERPKAALELNKKVTNVKITLANGNILFDAGKSVDNLIWVNANEYNVATKMSNHKYNEYYQESKKDKNKNRYSYRNVINELIASNHVGEQNGLIQATMDEELMHGATIQISYLLNVKNAGEKDYTGKDFYYKGINPESEVTTTPNIVIDYVANNLQYRQQDNKNWQTIKPEELTANQKVEERLVNKTLEEQVKKYNTILQTTALAKNLKTGETITKDLYLTKTITPQNSQDDLSYRNIAEIVQTSNTVGRRMAYSVVGNQDPTKAPQEIDTAQAEKVMILPPFGKTPLYFYLAIALLAFVTLGTFLFVTKLSQKGHT